MKNEKKTNKWVKIIFLCLIIFIIGGTVIVSFSNKDNQLKETKEEKATEFTPFEPQVKTEPKKSIKTEPQETKKTEKTVKIFLLDKNAKLRSVNRTCNPSTEKSCFEFAIKELVIFSPSDGGSLTVPPSDDRFLFHRHRPRQAWTVPGRTVHADA